ncbi:hypothetical protein E3U43_000174 [Larimichthys crocea]|uniref:Uncharacterized protein n=1 Tax=Larimichthys crocea TaxID=215358 RepID=A0ACD3Q7V6_LARCR|nr:hypothetical protein E3U43_000174 [Larimichthys crocea]
MRKSRPTDSTSQSHTDVFRVGINAAGASALHSNDEFVQKVRYYSSHEESRQDVISGLKLKEEERRKGARPKLNITFTHFLPVKLANAGPVVDIWWR